MFSNLLSFFFSSRRRHTRWPRDWSSDVCSSDLNTLRAAELQRWIEEGHYDRVLRGEYTRRGPDAEQRPIDKEIGRASCRERGHIPPPALPPQRHNNNIHNRPHQANDNQHLVQSE